MENPPKLQRHPTIRWTSQLLIELFARDICVYRTIDVHDAKWVGLLLAPATPEMLRHDQADMRKDAYTEANRTEETGTDLVDMRCIEVWCRSHVWSRTIMAEMPTGWIHVQEVHTGATKLRGARAGDVSDTGIAYEMGG